MALKLPVIHGVSEAMVENPRGIHFAKFSRDIDNLPDKSKVGLPITQEEANRLKSLFQQGIRLHDESQIQELQDFLARKRKNSQKFPVGFRTKMAAELSDRKSWEITTGLNEIDSWEAIAHYALAQGHDVRGLIPEKLPNEIPSALAKKILGKISSTPGAENDNFPYEHFIMPIIARWVKVNSILQEMIRQKTALNFLTREQAGRISTTQIPVKGSKNFEKQLQNEEKILKDNYRHIKGHLSYDKAILAQLKRQIPNIKKAMKNKAKRSFGN